MIINIDWKGKTFRVVGADKENNFTYDEVKEFFVLNDSSTTVCLKDVGIIRKGELCIIIPGPEVGSDSDYFICRAIVGENEHKSI